MRIGQARLTAGLDRFASIGLREHEEIFGSLRRLATAQLIDLAESVDLRGRGGAEPGYPGPGHSDPGYPDVGYPDPSDPYQGWAGHDEPAQAPGRGDGGR